MVRQGRRYPEPLNKRLVVAFSLDGSVRGDLVLLAKCHVTFAEIAVIRKEIGNGSELSW